MPPVRPLPPTGSVFLDDRGSDRALRVTWHPEADVVVLSLWRDNLCAGSFRIPAADVPALISALAAGLAAGHAPAAAVG
jgi:hypothetical protein